MTQFRPCIDLHGGCVKQIVGGSLRDAGPGPQTHFVADRDPAYFAGLYRDDHCRGGHVIRLGGGNDEAAREALGAWPGGLQLGGGIDIENAQAWLDAGAAKLIVTSWLFEEGELSLVRAAELADRVGAGRVVIDLSCRRRDDDWWVATDRWQTVTRTRVELLVGSGAGRSSRNRTAPSSIHRPLIGCPLWGRARSAAPGTPPGRLARRTRRLRRTCAPAARHACVGS